MHWVYNGIVLLFVILGVWAGVWVSRNRLWRDAAGSLWRRCPIAILVVGLYLVIGLLDSVTWVSAGSTAVGGDMVAASKPRSVIDRVFAAEEFVEKSYSAPLASHEFFGGAPLSYPGTHLFGTDMLGRDVLYRTLKGIQIALLIGGLTSLIAIPLALLFGVSAGYFGGWIDDIIFFFMSVLASIPGLLLLIALIMALGRGPFSVCIALGVTSWVGFCRLSRAETFKLRELDYVEAARALGASDWRIITRHILPNLSHLIIITFVLLFSGLVLSETVLAYLGIGVDGSWGYMIDQARNELSRAPAIWWNLFGATVGLFGLILAVNMIGDAVRDVLDPRTLREGE